MRLVSAAWIVPVTRPPIRDGAVLIADDGTIAAVGNATELTLSHAPEETVVLGDVVVTPGLVNAHTHLGLTAASGLLGPDDFPAWLAQVPRIMRAWSPEDIAASAALGAAQSLDAGVTVVGEIAYTRAACDAVIAAGLGGAFYWEVLGLDDRDLERVLAENGLPERDSAGPRVMFGLSPHAPYSSGPGLLRAAHEYAAARGLPFAVHVAESAAETELLESGTGPLRDVAGRLALDFRVPGTSAVSYLERLGALTDALAVHVCEARGDDLLVLATQARGVVLCPRSNEYLRNRYPLAEELAAMRVPIAVGTDSAASNEDLDVLRDVRALKAIAPALSETKLLRAVTFDAAWALGFAGRFGALEPGYQADMVAFEVVAGAEPERAVVEQGGAPTLRAAMTAGTWRIADGVAREDRRPVEAAAARASEAARAALAEEDA